MVFTIMKDGQRFCHFRNFDLVLYSSIFSKFLLHHVSFFVVVVPAMRRLQEKGASYFVLDLRDNLGGLVQVCSSRKLS